MVVLSRFFLSSSLRFAFFFLPSELAGAHESSGLLASSLLWLMPAGLWKIGRGSTKKRTDKCESRAPTCVLPLMKPRGRWFDSFVTRTKNGRGNSYRRRAWLLGWGRLKRAGRMRGRKSSRVARKIVSHRVRTSGQFGRTWAWRVIEY